MTSTDEYYCPYLGPCSDECVMFHMSYKDLEILKAKRLAYDSSDTNKFFLLSQEQ